MITRSAMAVAVMLAVTPALATEYERPPADFAALLAEAEENRPPPPDLAPELANTATAWRLIGDRVDIQLADGRIASAPAQMIGYWLVREERFDWAWNGADDGNPALDAVKSVRASGEEWGISELAGGLLPSSKDQAQQLFLVALYLAGDLSPFTAMRQDGNRALMGVGPFVIGEAAE